MKKWQGKILPEHHIEHAFTCGEVPYFNFTDSFNIPCERAMDALHIYQEFKNRTDDIYLKAFCMTKQNLYKKNPINVFELKKLDDQLQERIEMALPPPRIIENLASVTYFDETENPYKYDRAYAEQKIAKWKTEKIFDKDDLEVGYDFFLSKAINSLLPSFQLDEDSFQQYLQIAKMIDLEHLKTIGSELSLPQQKAILYNQQSFTSILERAKS